MLDARSYFEKIYLEYARKIAKKSKGLDTMPLLSSLLSETFRLTNVVEHIVSHFK